MLQHPIIELVNCMQVVNQKTDNNAKFNIWTFAVRANFDELYPHYLVAMRECNDAFMKHVKKGEDGKPLEKLQLVKSINETDKKPKQYDFEDEEAYRVEMDKIYEKDIPVNLVKYDIKDLLECKIGFGDTESFIILKNISL